MKYLFSLLAIVSVTFAMYAEPIERIILKGGTILEGHIASQVLGDCIVFNSEVATVVVPKETVNIIPKDGKNVEFSKLDSKWKKWLESNDAQLITIGDKKYLKLSDVVVASTPDAHQKEYPILKQLKGGNVCIVETGSEIKYVDVHNQDYSIKHKDIEKIEKILRDNSVLSGIVDVIVKNDGDVIRGQIVSQELGKGIRMRRDDNGYIESIEQKDIKSQNKEPLNSDQDLFEQVQYLDVIYQKSNKNTDGTEGVIIVQTSNDSINHITVKKQNGEEVKIPVKEIEKIKKRLNDKYNPIIDRIIDGDDIYVCGKVVNKHTLKDIQNDKADFYIDLSNDSVPKFSLKDINGSIIIECYSNEKNKDFSLNPIEFKELKISGKRNMHYVSTYKDIWKEEIPPLKQTGPTANNTLRLEYALNKGVYAFIRKSDFQCIVFEVTE